MKRFWVLILAVMVVGASIGSASLAEKVMFHQEGTGVEMWRLTSRMTFHEYHHADKPFTRDGQYMVCREHEGDLRIVVVNLADGSEYCFGGEHRSEGTTENPVFVRRDGRLAVVYGMRNTEGGSVYLHYLDTGEERTVVKMPPGVRTLTCGVIGPNAEYVMLRGDMTGDGLSDWSVKSLWTNEPIRVMWTSPTTEGWPKTVTPVAQRNRVNLTTRDVPSEMLKAVRHGEDPTNVLRRPDGLWQAHVAVLDLQTLKADVFPSQGLNRWTHEAWSGDGEFCHVNGYSWRISEDASTTAIRIGDAPASNHYGTCGRSGRHLAGDSGRDGMERLEMTDLWTGERWDAGYISATTEPPGGVSQDHGHPSGSLDGTKVLVHSCYDHVNHRLYAIPTADVQAGDQTIAVETTDGFAHSGALLIGTGDRRFPRLQVRYASKDDTHFHGCQWGENAQARLDEAMHRLGLPAGTLYITDALGRLYPDGKKRPRKEYVLVVRQPDPPRGLMASHEGSAVRLTWGLPASHCETAGYAIYRRVGDAPLERLNDELVSGVEYLDTRLPAGRAEYFVRAVEHSGLYGAPAGPAWAKGTQAGTHVLDSYDVPGCAFIERGQWPTADERSVTINVPTDGEYVLWGRGRAWQDRETVSVSVDGQVLADVTVQRAQWHWMKLVECALSAGEHTVSLRREMAYEPGSDRNLLTNPDFEDGLDGWEFDKTVTSVETGMAHSGEKCVKLSGGLTEAKLMQIVEMAVKPEWSYRLSYWMRGKFTKGYTLYEDSPEIGRYCNQIRPFKWPRNAVVSAATFDDKQWYRKEIVIDTPGLRPEQRPLTQMQVYPYWQPAFWVEHEGEMWFDDVELVEVGPRLRPLKMTKLLVTSTADYTPKGRDGRDAHDFPAAPLIPVTGLRCTVQREGVTVAWDASRPGTRGHNVYSRPSADCPASKYFQRTSVWRATSVALDGLGAGKHAVTVTAINEDGINGPAATIRVSVPVRASSFSP